MRDHRRIIQSTIIAASLFLGGLVLLLAGGVPAAEPLRIGASGASVHAKNAATPDWMLELQARNARQQPVVLENGEPSYWI